MKMLFCSDGRKQADNAVRFGALIAAACQAETSILGVAERTSEQEPLLQSLRREQLILKEYHLDAELISKAGRPVREIAKRARESDYDMVVIGAEHNIARGKGWTSARAYKIIESVEPPVLVVIGERLDLRRILLCSSGRPSEDKAVEHAGEIARSGNAVVDLFHVMDEPPAIYANLIRMKEDADRLLSSRSKLGRALRRHKELLEQFGVFGEFLLRHGLVVPETLKELQRNEYDMVVTGSSPAADRLRTYVMGNVTREIVNRADLPVLVLRTEPTQIMARIGDFVTHLFRRSRVTSEAATN
jgi:nucleotide-binding universal stress UspA family protein